MHESQQQDMFGHSCGSMARWFTASIHGMSLLEWFLIVSHLMRSSSTGVYNDITASIHGMSLLEMVLDRQPLDEKLVNRRIQRHERRDNSRPR
jgi:hypothetical protein